MHSECDRSVGCLKISSGGLSGGSPFFTVETVPVVMESVLEKVDLRYSGVLKGNATGCSDAGTGVEGVLVIGAGDILGTTAAAFKGVSFWILRTSYLEGRPTFPVLKAIEPPMSWFPSPGLKR